MHRFSMETFSAKSPGLGAGRAVQYLTRTGEFRGYNADRDGAQREDAQFQIEHMTGLNFPAGHRTDLRHVEPPNNLPDWAHDSATYFFQSAEKHERKGGQFYSILELSLPRELDRAQQLELTRDFVQAILPDKVHFWVLHEPSASDYHTVIDDYLLPPGHGLQPHVHIMVSARNVGDGSREEAEFFKQPNARSPERGGFGKDRFFADKHAPLLMRRAWSDLTNVALEQAGVDRRVSADPLWKQGLHPLYPYQDPGHYREEERSYAPRPALEREHQQAYATHQWAIRAQALGLERLDHPALVREIGRQAREIPRRPERSRDRQRDFGTHPRMHRRQVTPGTWERPQERPRERQRLPSADRVQEVLQAWRREEDVDGPGVQYRPRERDREQGHDRGEDRGMSW